MPEREIAAERVRFIKLGEGGCWEEECLRDSIVRLGYDTQHYFNLCDADDWGELKARYLAQTLNTRVATGRANQVRQFCKDDGRTLWVTFHDRQMWWAFMDPDVRAAPHSDGQGIFRRTREPWRNTDSNGGLLTLDVLAGSFTKVVGYKQTICKVADDNYVLRRVNAQLPQVVIDAIEATEQAPCASVVVARTARPAEVPWGREGQRGRAVHGAVQGADGAPDDGAGGAERDGPGQAGGSPPVDAVEVAEEGYVGGDDERV